MGIEQKVIEVLAEKLGDENGIGKADIGLDARIREDLHLDSLSAIEMLFDLESEYDIDISDEEAQTFVRVRDIVAYLEDRGIK